MTLLEKTRKIVGPAWLCCTITNNITLFIIRIKVFFVQRTATRPKWTSTTDLWARWIPISRLLLWATVLPTATATATPPARIVPRAPPVIRPSKRKNLLGRSVTVLPSVLHTSTQVLLLAFSSTHVSYSPSYVYSGTFTRIQQYSCILQSYIRLLRYFYLHSAISWTN